MQRFLVLFVLLFFSMLFSPLTLADTPLTKQPDVQAFIQLMVKKHGFKKTTLTALFNAVKIRPQVMKHINKPLEKETWRTYQLLFVNEWRISHGVKFWNKYNDALKRAEAAYGVPASIIVATIGVETKYGQNNGEYRVMDALTNIAFSGTSRAAFFRKELEQFLLLTREQHLDPLQVFGSYAGAIGQPQFMPSSYRYYAVNFSKSGKIDLMHNEIDVIGSIANYYKQHGWKPNQPIAVEATLVGNRYHDLLSNKAINHAFTLQQIAKYGIVPKNKIVDPRLPIKLIELQSHYTNEYWLGFNNFEVIKRYNPSDLYAMAVYQLSVYISALRDRTHHG